ncbi:hypothetical protein [Salinilacihabitans rarus]|uniref:hypothetical protein n=1 Tax=Salinilacihabitans rarus TaxID=2961596 RepID=UPI0020C83D56|nr:hypothetical protein [Salinilacihabitans rarus]
MPTSLTRRRLLAAGSAAGLAAVAGCIADGPNDRAAGGDGGGTEPDGNETDGDGENDGHDDENGDDGTYVLRDSEVLTYSTPNGETSAEALLSRTDADDRIEYDALAEEDRSRVESFVDETDFDEAVIVQVRVRLPDHCHDVEVEEVDADEDGLSVRARAVDDGGADEMCAQALHTVTALVRAVFEDEVPKTGSIHVVDADGSEHGFGYGSASDGE